MLQQRTADGYVFRVDLRLRPDPASTPVAISTASALNYYEREGPHLGARRDDQGAALRRRRRRRRGAARRDRAVRLAQASRLRRARRRPRHEAADADLSRPDRDRGRRPQRQGRPRRHPRDRVLRPDPAIDRRRPASGIAGAADAGRARHPGHRATGSPSGARRTDRGLSIPAPRRAPAADDRRRADPHAAGRRRGGRAVRALPRLRQPRRVRRAICWRI